MDNEKEIDGEFNVLIQVYKIRQSDRYLHFTSAQAWHEKTTAIPTLTLGALNYCSTQELLEHYFAYITEVFWIKGFHLCPSNK